ncbi:hypothetical protein ASF53_19540 [Methylobacterium sp. Leaf123]|uniref:hypothetical protein n=1 Tax=Methylobacterium sp. Leaf123 TaxID=1736264 RepID=UPI0006F48067|nr:hypothetical protein [Methylobacterium sp. Leaf123]KQQ29427.1 hypothetical protein ASF53_19540 [Methylobacterium sp. Leaf123]
MTNSTTRKPDRDPAVFGREIAQFAKAELENLGLTIAEVGAKERQLKSIKQRAIRSIDLAAAAQVADGMSAADSQAWANAAAKSFGETMDERA